MWSQTGGAIREGTDNVLSNIVSTVIRNRDKGGKARLLWWAVFKGRTDMVKKLIKSKADVNKKWDGWIDTSETNIIKVHTGYVEGNAFCQKRKLTPLWTAAALGAKEIVTLLTNAGADVDLGGDICPPLWVAAYNGHIKVVEHLIKAEALLDVKDNLGRTELYVAASHEHNELVELLIKAGADIDATDLNGKSVLWIASCIGNEQIVERLISAGVDLDGDDFYGISSLCAASATGHKSVVKLLIKSGADIEAKDDNGMSALVHASGNGHKEILELLIISGSECNATDNNGLSALCMASNNGHKEVVELLINAGANIESRSNTNATCLHFAAWKGYDEIVKILINAGADINARSNDNFSILFLASNGGHNEVVKILISAGVDINTVDNRGWSACHAAADNGHIEVIALLIKAGADIKIKSNNGETALFLAARYGKKEVVEALVSAGADVNDVDSKNTSPLSVASYNGHKDVVKLLLDCDVDIEAKDGKAGTSALLGASQSGFIGVVELLIDAGADTGVKANEGQSALLLASSYGHKEVVQCLIQRGVDIEARDIDDRSALWVASFSGHKAVVEVLLNVGADIEARDRACGSSVLLVAASNGHKEIVECLFNAGASMDEGGFSPLFSASQNGHKDVVEFLVGVNPNVKTELNKCLHAAVCCGHMDVVDVLIDAGAEIKAENDKGCLQLFNCFAKDVDEMTDIFMKCGINTESMGAEIHIFNLLLVAVSNNHQDAVISFLKRVTRLSPACMSSLIMCAVYKNNEVILQILVKHFNRNNKMHETFSSFALSASTVSMYRMIMILAARDGKPATDIGHSLPFQDVIDYSFFKMFSLNVLAGVPKLNLDIASLIHCPGLGNVACIPNNKADAIFKHIHNVIEELTERCLARFTTFKHTSCGSVAEGTCVGLPDEVDYLFKFSLTVAQVEIRDFRHGYKYCVRNSSCKLPANDDGVSLDRFCFGSKHFHDKFFNHMALSNTKGPALVDSIPMVKDGGNASTEVTIKWLEPGTGRRIVASVDLVPVVHFKDTWPDTAICRTWMMQQHALKSRGFSLVAKPPNKNSALGQSMDEAERVKLWRISFSHLETEHLADLDSRVKDAYVAAKSLRNPDVCRILLQDSDGILRHVDKYITSYLLKTVFLHNVEDFLATDKSLIQMVYILYSELVRHLARGFLPLFWQQDVNVLEGLSIDTKVAMKVAGLMKILVGRLLGRNRKREFSPVGYYYYTLDKMPEDESTLWKRSERKD